MYQTGFSHLLNIFNENNAFGTIRSRKVNFDRPKCTKIINKHFTSQPSTTCNGEKTPLQLFYGGSRSNSQTTIWHPSMTERRANKPTENMSLCLLTKKPNENIFVSVSFLFKASARSNVTDGKNVKRQQRNNNNQTKRVWECVCEQMKLKLLVVFCRMELHKTEKMK